MNNIDKAVHYINNNNNANSNSIDINCINNNNNNNNNNIVLIDNTNIYSPVNYSASITLNKSFKIEQDEQIKNEIELRNLCSSDIPELKTLCAEWFPVE
jgi:hypothetical protein